MTDLRDSKPISRKAIKQALKKFCIIPDDTEDQKEAGDVFTDHGLGHTQSLE
jgi:hypothetical protein